MVHRARGNHTRPAWASRIVVSRPSGESAKVASTITESGRLLTFTDSGSCAPMAGRPHQDGSGSDPGPAGGHTIHPPHLAGYAWEAAALGRQAVGGQPGVGLHADGLGV